MTSRPTSLWASTTMPRLPRFIATNCVPIVPAGGLNPGPCT